MQASETVPNAFDRNNINNAPNNMLLFPEEELLRPPLLQQQQQQQQQQRSNYDLQHQESPTTTATAIDNVFPTRQRLELEQQQQQQQQIPPQEQIQMQLLQQQMPQEQQQTTTTTMTITMSTAAIVKNIASFLTMSDMASLISTNNLLLDNHQEEEKHNNGDNENYINTSNMLGDRCDSWAIGMDLEQQLHQVEEQQQRQQHSTSSPSSSSSLWEPQTPGLMVVSPGGTPCFDSPSSLEQQQQQQQHLDQYRRRHRHHQRRMFEESRSEEEAEKEHDQDEDGRVEEILWERKRRWVQQRLAAAVFSHPESVRSFCMQAYQSAKGILRERQLQQQRLEQQRDKDEDPETCIEPNNTMHIQQQRRYHRHHCLYHPRKSNKRRRLVSIITDLILNNVPLSVLFDVLEVTGEVTFDTTFASFAVTGKTLEAIVKSLLHCLQSVWHGICNFNPFALLEAIVSFQFNAMGKTSEVLASGIQSVATGVGSASSLALHRLSTANLSGARCGATPAASLLSTTITGDHVGVGGGVMMAANGGPGAGASKNLLRSTPATVLNQKLLRKLSAMNDAARVVRYMESQDETGGLTKQARSKVQRMMHYEVSLRPFVATVQGPSGIRTKSPSISPLNPPSFVTDFASAAAASNQNDYSRSSSAMGIVGGDEERDSLSQSSPHDGNSGENSPFIYTPQSFPATPHSRQVVMARGANFADDVVFLARDRLRLHDSLESENERTREYAKLLREGKRLAIFNARDASAGGIELSCGQHIATKAGNMLYCTTRSMVPVLRNCLVYFEMTVLPRSFGTMVGAVTVEPSMTTLSIGLSTEEMPTNALVGAWQGSCGLCTTGQIFAGGEWCAPSDPSIAAYRDGATIGCLVYLDDSSAVDTWEGLLVNATITYNVNGFLVAPVLTSSIGVAAAASAAAAVPKGMSQQIQLPHRAGATPQPAHHHHPDSSPRSVSSRSPGSPFGRQHERPAIITLSIKVPAAEELYPTVTLHSPATSVLSRFSAQDIVAPSRETIGAPPGATVYAVDGSVIFAS